MGDALGDRMKENYENVSRLYLTRRVPVIIRIDGKAFHTFTRGFEKPFDRVFMTSMQKTMKCLCENIQGCVLGYTQSDEITLVLLDTQTSTTDAWFGYNLQKMASVSASMATLYFNRIFADEVGEWAEQWNIDNKTLTAYLNACDKGAMFDARCFSIPREEVINCLIWRQQDATRNSIQSAAQARFSQRELEGLNTSQLQEKLFSEAGINWDAYEIDEKRGSCCIKVEQEFTNPDGETYFQSKWEIDRGIPIFTQNRNYVEQEII